MKSGRNAVRLGELGVEVLVVGPEVPAALVLLLVIPEPVDLERDTKFLRPATLERRWNQGLGVAQGVRKAGMLGELGMENSVPAAVRLPLLLLPVIPGLEDLVRNSKAACPVGTGVVGHFNQRCT